MLTPLLLVLFGIIEASRLFLTVSVVADAARQGARTGAVSPSPFSGVAAQAAVVSVLTAANLSAASNTVSCPGPCANGANVTATVSVTFQTAVPLLVPVFGSSLTVTRTSQMRYEGP